MEEVCETESHETSETFCAGVAGGGVAMDWGETFAAVRVTVDAVVLDGCAAVVGPPGDSGGCALAKSRWLGCVRFKRNVLRLWAFER